MTYSAAIVIGAGAFGTSIASVLCKNFEKVFIKVRSDDVYESIKNEKENTVYLKGLTLPDNLIPALEWDELNEYLKDAKVEVIISGLPTPAIRSYFRENKDFFMPFLERDVPLVNLAKGIDTETLELPDDLFYDIFPQKFRDNFLFLSGPSFAKEIIDEQVTLVSVAGRNPVFLNKFMGMMHTDYFKVLATYDIKGLLLGGALKNPLAIAAGIIEGLGYNHNTRAALITRGIVEMLRFGKVFNARPETFYGLSGMGDLILTTTGGLSRNKQFGLELAKGRKPLDIIQSQRKTVEGYKTTQAAYDLANNFQIHTRIIHGLYEVLYNELAAKEVINGLMKLPSTFED